MKTVTVINNVEYTNVGTHVTHCCGKHGCKYSGGVCPVADKVVEQEFACEWCVSVESLDAKIAELEKEKAWTQSLEARGLTVHGGDDYY